MENLPYTFISYAHADEAKTSALIRGMKEAGIRLWFDEGIEAGSEWPEYIAQKVMGCNRFVLLLSNAYLRSQNCKRELNFAISKKKEILSVYLEKVELSPGMEMQLGTYQAVFRDRFSSDGALLESLCRESFFRDCRIAEEKKEEPKREEPKREVPKDYRREEPFQVKKERPQEKEAPPKVQQSAAADPVKAVRAAVLACNEQLRKKHAFSFSFFPELSKKQKDNAVRVIAKGSVSGDQVIAVMDDTLFSSGKSGYLVTEDRFFCAGMTLATFEVSLKDLVGVSTPSKSHLLLSFADGSRRDLFFNNYYESFCTFFQVYLREMGR